MGLLTDIKNNQAQQSGQTNVEELDFSTLPTFPLNTEEGLNSLNNLLTLEEESSKLVSCNKINIFKQLVNTLSKLMK